MTVSLCGKPLDQYIAELQIPKFGDPMSPDEAKALAVGIAYKGLGKVAPNPLVGAVVVSEDYRFISAGSHEKLGDHHAEINALLHVPNGCRLDGATMYVTLEPCAHHGRTPACAPVVATSGLSRVVYGLTDPNPKVRGKGAEILQSHGIKCTLDETWHSAQTLPEVFLYQMQHKKPFVALKCATSLDGYIGYCGDQRAWITGERARRYGHFLRCYYDAIIIGVNTLIADNPTLDTRDAIVPDRQNIVPYKVVIDPQGRGLAQKKAWNILAKAPDRVLWLTKEGVAQSNDLAATGATQITVPTSNGKFSADSILNALKEKGITSVLLEGGAGIYSTFAHSDALRRIHWFQANKIFGSTNTIPAFKDAVTNFTASTFTPLGDDWLIDLRVKAVD